MCNVEVQRSNKDNHLKRVRYNASCITANTTEVGEKFENVPTLYVFYISEFDFLKGGETIYYVDKVIRGSNKVIDDGLHEIFVNTKIDDGTEIAELMQCFMQEEIENTKFPKLTQSVRYFKEDEKGVRYMCEIMDKERREGLAQGRKEGIEQTKLASARNLLKFLPDEAIAESVELPIEVVQQLRAEQ